MLRQYVLAVPAASFAGGGHRSRAHPVGALAVTTLPERASGEPAAVAQAGVPMVIMTLVHT
ncbi:MAG TPA: hypothetical protein VGJ54_15965 [Streptosporangiaceae bacterium]